MKSPSLTVDAIIEFENGEIVLIERANDPFKGKYALPGGFVEIGETVEQAVIREAKEETGLDISINKLVGVYSDPNRDPRGHTVSVVFHATPNGGVFKADSDAAGAIKTKEFKKISLAFDHNKILDDYY